MAQRLRSAFVVLNTWSTFSRPGIEARAAALIQGLVRDAVNIPAAEIQRARIGSMMRILVEIGTDVPDRHLTALARLGLVSFAFDDLVDQQDISTSDLMMRAEQFSECAAGYYVPEVACDPIARLLLMAAEDLRANPAAESLWPDWTRAARRMFTGIVEHRAIAERMWRGEPASMEELLEIGGRSIGMEAFAVAAWIALGTRRTFEARASLWAIAQPLAAAARLANDMISSERELRERGANLLFVLGPGGRALLNRRIERSLATADEMVAALPIEARAVGRFTADLARGIVDRYRRSDFHERIPSPEPTIA